MRPSPFRSTLLTVVTAVAVIAGLLVGITGQAAAAPARVVAAAPAGAGPVAQRLPVNATPRHGRSTLTHVEPYAPKAPTTKWTPSARPAGKVASSPIAAATHTGAVDIIAGPGDVMGSTSWIVYFNVNEPWTGLSFGLFDAETNAEIRVPGATLPNPGCPQRTMFCFSFQSALGWPIVDGHNYYATIIVFYADNTSVTSAPSNTAPAHFTPLPPTMAFGQTLGCVCPTSAGRTGALQVMNGDPVNTGTGAFSETATDLRMAGYGVPFAVTRTYTSLDTSDGMMGPGWNLSLDMRLTVTATTATFRAEDGSETVFTKSGTAWVTPPGARAKLSAVTGGFQLTATGGEKLGFDSAGLLTSILDQRGNGLHLAYTAGVLSSVTDAAGRVVAVTTAGGRITKVTLPDGRFVQYTYTAGRLTSFRDAAAGVTSYGYDAGGRLATITDPDGHLDVQNTYDATTGRVTAQTDALGKTTTYDWSPTFQDTLITDPDGIQSLDGYRDNVLVFHLNGNGDETDYRYDSQLRLSTVIDPLGNRFPLAYDANGNVSNRSTVALGAETDTYDAHNNLTKHLDGRGNSVTLTYDAFDRVLTGTDRAGGLTTLTYNALGLVATRKDALGKTTTYGYDTAGNRVSETSPLGLVTTRTYDSVGRLTSTVDPRGNVTGAVADNFRTTYGYDALDHVTSTTDPLGHTQTEAYDPAGNLTVETDAALKTTTYGYDIADHQTTVTDQRGKVTTTAYTPGGRVASVTTPTGDKTTYSYDFAGRIRTVTAPRGNVAGAAAADFTTTYSYDFNGNLVQRSHPYPGGGTAVTTATYDDRNRPIAVTDPLGRVTRTEYDPEDNVTATVDGLNQRTTYTYDKENRRLTVKDPRNNTTSYGYDLDGRQTSQTTPLGFTTSWGYDADGRRTSMVDPRGNVTGATPATFTTTYGYDQAGNLLTTTNPLGHATTSAYDAGNNVTSVIDANGKTTTFGYDVENRVVRVRGPDAPTDAQSTIYGCDAAGNVLTRTDPLGHATTYTYDDAGRLASVTDPLGRAETYGYDPDGNLTTTVTARGTGAGLPGGAATQAAGTITDTYDILGRRTGRTLGAGGTAYTFGYDAANQRASSTDPGGTETREYDLAGQLTAVARGTDRIDYAYDPAGNISSRTWNAVAATAAWDADNRPTGLTSTAGTILFGYDAAAELTSSRLPVNNGYTEARSYDPAGRLTRVATTRATAPPALTLAQYDLAYDPVGNPTTVIGNRAGTTRTDTYTYDAANRVTGLCYATTTCTGATQSMQYAYNLVGDRTSETRTGVTAPGTTNHSYDAADQITATTGAVAATYTYDRDGNQLTAGADTFTYDLANHTTAANVAGITSTYTYDADGNRRSAVSGATTTTYRWDVAGPLPMLATETSGTTVRSYRYDPQSAPLSMSVTGKGTHFLTTDWLGSVSDATTTAGTAEYAYTYEPFGAGPDPAPLVAGAPANPLRFAGEYRDPKTGVYNLRARQYAPGTGRFTSTDPVPPPVGDPAVAGYAYASDQATRLTDPTGEFPCPLGRNPDGGCRGGHEAHLAGQFAQGAGAAGRDFFLGLTAPAPVRGQQIINGAKATLADCYAGLTGTTDPIGACLRQASGLTDLIQGLTLAFHGCVYIGAYIATGGAIQLTLTLAPFGIGRAAGTARIAEDLPLPPVASGKLATLHGAERLSQEGFDEATIGATRAGRVLRQADGATVYLNEASTGKYDFIVVGDRGVITAHRGWSFKSVTRLAKNYGWIGWP